MKGWTGADLTGPGPPRFAWWWVVDRTYRRSTTTTGT